MRSSYKKIFKDKEKINELLRLRRSNPVMSIEALARYFECDHSSIIYQLKKNVHGYKKQSAQRHIIIMRSKAGHCPVCDMMLDSEYHKKYPCYN